MEKVKHNGTPPVRPGKPPYMSKDQMHHVIAVLWHALSDSLEVMEGIVPRYTMEGDETPEYAKISTLRKIVFYHKPLNENENEELS